MVLEKHITLRFSLANGKVGLNEIIHNLIELKKSLIQKQSVIVPEELFGAEQLKPAMFSQCFFLVELKNKVMP